MWTEVQRTIKYKPSPRKKIAKKNKTSSWSKIRSFMTPFLPKFTLWRNWNQVVKVAVAIVIYHLYFALIHNKYFT